MSTKKENEIMMAALQLFAQKGFDAITMNMIAKAVHIKAPSLYKHFQSKNDILNSILQEMARRDSRNVAGLGMPMQPTPSKNIGETSLPLTTAEKADLLRPEEPDDPDDEEIRRGQKQGDIPELLEYYRKMFRYWTGDEFAASFRRMMTIEQYKDSRMSDIYHRYFGAGPLGYTKDIVGSDEAALALYGPIYMLFNIYDDACRIYDTGIKTAVYGMLDDHLKTWYSRFGRFDNSSEDE